MIALTRKAYASIKINESVLIFIIYEYYNNVAMRKVFASFLVFASAFFILSAVPVSAKVIKDQKGTVTVAKTEVVNDDLFIGAESVVIDGTVNGDVFIGAQTVKITGIVNGNLHVGANSIDISGKVLGNVYAGGQNILLSGANIKGSLLAGGASINSDNLSVIGGSVIAGGGSILIDSKIGRSLYAGTKNLTVGDNAKIAGSIYKSEIKTPQRNIEIEKKVPGILHGFKIASTIISFFGAFIIGFLFFKFFPNSFSKSSKIVSGSFWKSVGIGFLVSMAFIPGVIVLFITVVGIPVAGIMILMFILYSYLAKIVVGSALGEWISKKFKWQMSFYGTFALGLFAVYLLKMIPVVGFFSGFIVCCAGLGALTLAIWKK